MVNTKCDPYSLRIATVEADLPEGYFYLQNIGLPNVIEYKDHSALVSQDTGGQAKQGYAHVLLTWSKPDPITVYKIKKLVDTVLAGTNQIYLTIPNNDGSVPGRDFIDVRGVPRPIVVTEGRDYGSPGIAYSALQLFINNLTIINNPATFQ